MLTVAVLRLRDGEQYLRPQAPRLAPKIAKGCEHTSQSFERVTAKTIVDPGDERITYARGSSGGCNDPGQGSGQLDLRAGGSY